MGRALRSRRAGTGRGVVALLAPDLAATLTVASPSFDDGGPIPPRHAGPGVGQNVSPALDWSPAPAGTAQLLFVMEDPDVPAPRPIVHSLAVFDAGVTGVGEGGLGRYSGPRALPGHGPHVYGLHVFALDRVVVEPGARPRFFDVVRRARGHVIARGALFGVQER
ncbi:YbhB/YbcL family Raf kinase inhibitor-like protein [Xylanimonas ulmi]